MELSWFLTLISLIAIFEVNNANGAKLSCNQCKQFLVKAVEALQSSKAKPSTVCRCGLSSFSTVKGKMNQETCERVLTNRTSQGQTQQQLISTALDFNRTPTQICTDIVGACKSSGRSKPSGNKQNKNPQGQRGGQRPNQWGQAGQGKQPNQGWQQPNQGWQQPNQGRQRPNQGWQQPNQGWQGQQPNQGWQGQQPNQGWQGQQPNQGWQGQQPNQGWQGQQPNQGWQGQQPSQGGFGGGPEPVAETTTKFDINKYYEKYWNEN